ncbi:unnamed protein product, partial [marine sediment metagenome]
LLIGTLVFMSARSNNPLTPTLFNQLYQKQWIIPAKDRARNLTGAYNAYNPFVCTKHCPYSGFKDSVSENAKKRGVIHYIKVVRWGERE